MKYRANFFDKNGDETRSLTIEIPAGNKASEEAIEVAACLEADKRGWPDCFKFSDA